MEKVYSTSTILLISLLFISQGRLSSGLDVSKILLITEVGKLILLCLCAGLKKHEKEISLSKAEPGIIGEEPILLRLETFKDGVLNVDIQAVALPAIFMAISHRLFYYAASNLPSPLIQLSFPFDGLFSAIMLQYTGDSAISPYSPLSLLAFGFGIAFVQLSATTGSRNLIALGATLVGSSFSALGNGLIYQGAINSWIKQAQISIISMLIFTVLVIAEWDDVKDSILTIEVKLLIAFNVLNVLLFDLTVQEIGLVKTKLANTASIVVALLIGGIFYNLHFNWIHLAIGLILIIMSVHYIPKLMEITPTTSGTLSKPSRIILFSCFIVCSYYFSQLDSYLEPPTIVFAELRSNDVMQVVNKAYCGWGFFNNARNGTQDSFGWREPARGVSSFPALTNSEQFSLDDILYTRVADYPKLLPSHQTDEADFIWLPTYSVLLGNGFGCNNETYINSTAAVILEIRKYVASLPPSKYPRVILPISTIRSAQNTYLLTQELSRELGSKLIIISIESAPLWWDEDAVTHLIDVPYPGRFHLAQDETESWKRKPVPTHYLELERPNLISYGGSDSHVWQGSIDDPINGFQLRHALKKTIDTFLNSTATTPKIIFDDFTTFNPDFEFLMKMYDHMTRSVFCLQPAGDTPSRKSFFESMNQGCIPVIFRKTSYGRLFPSSPEIDPSLFTVFIPENEIINGEGLSVIERLQRISPKEIRAKQLHIAQITRKLQWSYPLSNVPIPINATRLAQKKFRRAPSFDDDAFGMILKELATIKSGKWKSRSKTGLFDDKRIILPNSTSIADKNKNTTSIN